MDANILKSIYSSSTLNAESAEKKECDKNHEEFPVTAPVYINGLSKILTKLLSYKVSTEVTQYYSVRLNIIETFRDWSRMKGDLSKLPVFQDSEKSWNILLHILKKYLSEEIISSCDDVDNLVQLATVLLHSMSNDKMCKRYFAKVMARLLDLDQSEKSEKFLLYLLENSSQLKVESCMIEKIYTIQKSLLIEKPLADCFSEFCLDKSKEDKFKSIDIIFKNVTDSPSLFLLISNYLKSLFIMTRYAEQSQDFIKKVLEKVESHCEKCRKDTFDLYPTNLQFCVLLLRIKPCYHNEKSKNHTVQALKQIFLEDNNNALILISHFPEWLPDYLKFFEILEESSQSSVTQHTVEVID